MNLINDGTIRTSCLPGQIFGNVEIINYAGYLIQKMKDGKGNYYDGKLHYWNVRCLICGSIKPMQEWRIKSCKLKSCGCQQYVGLYNSIEKNRANNPAYIKGEGNPSYTHGGSEEPLYTNTYASMKARCFNPNNKRYHNYGGRGITVDPIWLGEDGYANFRKWAYEAGYRPELQHQLSIERKDVNKNYGPDNCIWAGLNKSVSQQMQQGNNTTANHKVIWGGLEYTITELARHFGHTPDYIFYRIGPTKGGKTIEEAMLAPKWKPGRAGSIQREKYIMEHGEFKQNPNAVNPLICLKYPEIDPNDPKLMYFDEETKYDDLAKIRGIAPSPVETEEEYQKAREAAKQSLINFIKNQ